MSKFAILDKDKNVVPCSFEEWAPFFEDMDNRRVGHDVINGYRVSTVFLGSDHSFGEGPPLWFETLFDGPGIDEEIFRYTTWDEAWEAHRTIVQALEKVLDE